MTMTREHWLGYLMGALDENEQASVERQIAQDPRAAEEIEHLRSHLNLLADGLDEAAPPTGLASRTCDLLDNPGLFAEILDPVASTEDDAPMPKSRQPFESIGGSRPNFTMMDMMVAMGACVAAVVIFFPALASSRMLATQLQCENNLRQVGLALHDFATGNAEKRYPAIPSRGPLSVAGSYAPRLIDNGMLQHPEVVRCSTQIAPALKPKMPTVDQMMTATPGNLKRLQEQLANVYNYNIGSVRDGELIAPKMNGRETYPVASDVVLVKDGQFLPRAHEDGRLNILFDDGHVELVHIDDLPDSIKQFFLNDKGQVAAGVNEDDAVIANAVARPLFEAETNPVP
ncbi:hypothetical protein GC197_12250 [bacterium]|nr:hypothetical protein [bacterium]